MATVDEMEAACIGWLNKRRQKLTLARTLYLVPGFEDEQANCWLSGPNAVSVWGSRVFADWTLAIATRDGPESSAWKAANVRVIDFSPDTHRDSFLEFATEVRGIIHDAYPDDGAPIGEFDVVCHSMGGLDAFVAMVDETDTLNPVDPEKRVAKAFNFVTIDTPYRGIPNVDARIKMSAKDKVNQCEAMRPGGEKLKLIGDAAARLPERATRITCYGVDTATQVEVDSGNLYADEARFAPQRTRADYRFFQIPGSSHSGSQGITQSPITMANLFHTITTSDRLS